MRVLPLLPLALLAGCTTGNIADHIGARDGIVSPQLIRYGLDLRETQCVSAALGDTLSPLQLRLLRRAAGAVTQGYYDPERLTLRDLSYVAGQVDAKVAAALAAAVAGCGVEEDGGEQPPTLIIPPPASANWLNLGKAESGQGMAIDISTIEGDAPSRNAWFRMTDARGKPSDDIFLLQVDCAAKTINPRARRRLDPAGAVVESREYPDNPLPVETGTVMAIAYLSLCA